MIDSPASPENPGFENPGFEDTGSDPGSPGREGDAPPPEGPGAPSDKLPEDLRPEDLEGVRRALDAVEHLVEDRELLARLPEDLRRGLVSACGRLARPTRDERHAFKKERRRQLRKARRDHDRAILARTRQRTQRLDLVYPTPNPLEDPRDAELPVGPLPEARLIEGRTCYICKAEYREVHSFYDALCHECAEFNYRKRTQTADLTGRVSLLTGGRVKIGYQAAIKLLRAGSRVIVTTRFARDAALRFAREKDFEDWQHRLDLYGLDLRHTPSVEGFLSYVLGNYDRLDFILNNACQTVRRPPGFYAHLMDAEQLPLDEEPVATRRLVERYADLQDQAGKRGEEARIAEGTGHGEPDRNGGIAFRPGSPLVGVNDPAQLSQIPLVDGDTNVGDHLFPAGRLDADLQQVDQREINSWRLPLADVSTVELLEVHLVNAVAPFVINARLKPLMLRTAERDKHIVNVSAMEGQFYRAFKTDKHPHTNMAKASLNMMTRTSAPDYQRDGIHMNSVDTGWITDEDPIHITLQKQEEHGFHPPLDHVDAAARICDPIFDGILTGTHMWGQFLKDYKPTRW